GDKILAMNLAHGGHLTLGHPANFSGKFYTVSQYGVSEKTEQLDYDALQKQAEKVKPVMITAGASAYPRIIDFPRLRQIADSVGAILFIDMAHIAGLVAGGQHPTPIPHAQFITTTTHKSLRGPRSGTPAVTTRGMKEEEMLDIADLLAEALANRSNADALEQVRQKVLDLTRRFPLPI